MHHVRWDGTKIRSPKGRVLSTRGRFLAGGGEGICWRWMMHLRERGGERGCAQEVWAITGRARVLRQGSRHDKNTKQMCCKSYVYISRRDAQNCRRLLQIDMMMTMQQNHTRTRKKMAPPLTQSRLIIKGPLPPHPGQSAGWPPPGADPGPGPFFSVTAPNGAKTPINSTVHPREPGSSFVYSERNKPPRTSYEQIIYR